jgi:hypothetical protein
VGSFEDIVVTIADKPWRCVFWRGTRCLPSWVTGHGRDGIWSHDQGPEFYDGRCYEHMSDMLCRFSKVRIIHRSDARVVVHWRNASGSIACQWIAKDAEGWGIWTDEYWTIYPDGIAIRHQLVHNRTDPSGWAEPTSSSAQTRLGLCADRGLALGPACMRRRRQLGKLARTCLSALIELLLRLEAEVRALRRQVKELKDRLALTSRNSGKPPSTDGLAKPAPKSLHPLRPLNGSLRGRLRSTPERGHRGRGQSARR